MTDSRPSFWDLPDRRVVLAGSVLAAVVFIALLTLVLGDSRLATIFLDRAGFFPYPLTIQNLLWVLFFVGLGETFVRWRVARRELGFVHSGYLPEDDSTVLQARDLGPLRSGVARLSDGEHGFLPHLIELSILQFQSSRSVDQTVSVLNSGIDLISHRVDLRYSLLRYLSWVIPTVGFIGTVIGIAQTLAQVDPTNPDLAQLTASLAVAFNTTLVALLLSAVLVLLQISAESLEERSVNQAGDYCLRNLINRLYTGRV